MNPLLADAGAASSAADAHHLLVVAERIGVTLALAGFLAYRPWRALLRRPGVGHEIAQAQILIAIAGAIMVAIIGDNVARAFGLVGLGGLIRFRSGIKDTRDAAVMFSMIGVGMACGLGLFEVAGVATACVAATALAFDALTSVAADTYRVTLTVDDAAVAGPQLAAALPAARVVTMPIAGDGPHQIVVELPDRVPVDAAALGRRLTAGGLSGLRAVEVEDA
ncbi:MAG: DUF4956 domain-containing protein [Kofleriaceae bacterium]|jgi:hypothetical protein|nr:DUF4956 domain-containing protein [Kofleriaceae bacterium]MBP9168405.1 DUF4956 domain-containing protein [Kofleriaceae bacterium]MBP9861402.1 DUF4956 domain-containing protein [Kofleriaceae bacterium]